MPPNNYSYKDYYTPFYRQYNPNYDRESYTSPYYYDNNRLNEIISEMYFPEVVPAGSKYDYAQLYGFGTVYSAKKKLSNGEMIDNLDRAHYLPALPIIFPTSLISYTQSDYLHPNLLLKTVSEEIPHAWLGANGYQDLTELGQDFLLYGEESLLSTYNNPYSFEGITHGLKLHNPKLPKLREESLQDTKKILQDLGIDDVIVDWNGDGKKDYEIPGIGDTKYLYHSPLGAQYWIEAYLRKAKIIDKKTGKPKVIDEKTMKDTIDKLMEYHNKGRTDAYYDQAWNLNKDPYKEKMLKLGFTDGGDVKRIVTPFFNAVNFVSENLTVAELKKDLYIKEKELEKALKEGKITKTKYNEVKKLYKKARESLNKKGYATIGKDFTNAAQSVKKGNFGKAVNSTFRGVGKVWDTIGGFGVSLGNVGTNFILGTMPQKNKNNVRKKIYKATDTAIAHTPLFAKKAVKKAQPYVKSGIHSVWNTIPSGNFKDAIKDNRILQGARNFLKHYGFWKNGGVLNILDMLIY